MAVSSAGLRLRRSGKAQKQLYSKLQTHPLVREAVPRQGTRNHQTKKQKSDHGLQMEARHQDRLSDWLSVLN
jgi:hypothetical protein